MSMRQILRDLTVLSGCANAQFDTSATPDTPFALFVDWLQHAIAYPVAEPHAMTLSTADAEGRVNSRVLILKDVDASGWYFAHSKASPKGLEIQANANVALAFYWQPLARQIRIRGVAQPMDEATNRHDFLSRSAGARALAIVGKQSDPLVSESDIDEHRRAQLSRLESDPELVSANWTVYRVVADSVEFWQGDPERNHKRLRYRRSGDRFEKERLWP